MKYWRVYKIVIIAIGMILTGTIGFPALAFLYVPRPALASEFLLAIRLTSIPNDGVPREYVVRAEDQDAWTKHSERIVGRVYLMRSADDKVRAFPTRGRFGISIRYDQDAKVFKDACWGVRFDIDGNPLGKEDLDIHGDTIAIPLKTESTDVWIRRGDLISKIN